MKKLPPWVWAALAALAVWHAALKRPGMALPLIIDEGEYSYQARLLSEGGLPYRDAYSPKPPMIFFLYRTAYALSCDPAAPRRLALAAEWATLALLLAASPAAWSWAARLAAPAAFAALSAYPAGSLGFAANTELFVAAFLTLAACALRRAWESQRPARWAWLSGAAAGAALMTKPTCLWTTAAFAALLAWQGRGPRLNRLAAYAAGGALAPLAFVFYFAARGGLALFWEDAVRHNMDYARVALATGAWQSQLEWLARTVAPVLLKGSWPACVLAGFGLWGVQAKTGTRDAVLIVAWLATGLAGLTAGLFFFPHYFLQVLPAVCLAGGLGVERLCSRRRWLGPVLSAALAVYPAAAAARAFFVDPPEVLAKGLLYPNPLYESVAAADYIRTHSSAEDSIYVFGSEPQIYVYAGRRCATEHITVLPLTMYPKPGDGAAELAKLSAAQPKFVVFATQPGSTLVASRLGEEFRRGVLDWLARDYRYAGAVSASGALPGAFVCAPPGDKPAFDSDSSLLVFDRR